MKWNKATAIVLSGAMVLSLTACGDGATTTTTSNKKSATESALANTLDNKVNVKSGNGDYSKEETVYVMADAAGTKNSTIVSDWLKNMDRTETLEDSSSLSGIKNVKGNEKLTQSGEDLSWNANGADIYYQGNTDKAAPVSVKLTYYLDGKDMAPKDMAGKSGKVKIHVEYKNESKVGDVYTPFMMATGMILDGDKFSNIDVSKGKVIADGNNNIVIGAGFPGLTESLNVNVGSKKVDLDLPEAFDVTADVKDFKLDMTMTVATSALFEDIDTDDLDTDELFGKIDNKLDAFSNGISDLAKGIKKYTDGVTKIKAGSKQLSSGTSQLKSKAGTLSTGVGKLKTGSGQLKAGFEGKKGALTAASVLAKGLADANTKLSDFSIPTAKVPETTPQQQQAIIAKAGMEANSVVNSYLDRAVNDPSMSAIKGIIGEAQLRAILKSAFDTGYIMGYGSGMKAGAQQAVDTINTTIASMAPQMTQLKSGIQTAATVAGLLNTGIQKMYTGTTQLNTGLTTLNKNVPALISGVNSLDTGAQKIDKYLGQLNSNSGALVDGSNKLKSGTKTLVTKVTDMEGDAKTLANRITSLVNAGKNYNTFTGIKSGKSGSVKFVIKTEGIQK